jgi:hypothetical protein
LRPLPQFSLAVVGADYPNKCGPTRRFEIALCLGGEPVELVLEPRNPADSHAVAVFSQRGVQLGYLTAERAPRIGSLIRHGREVRAVFQEPAAYGAVIRIALDGVRPTLPAAAPSAAAAKKGEQPDEQQDWWPDQEWPDE